MSLYCTNSDVQGSRRVQNPVAEFLADVVTRRIISSRELADLMVPTVEFVSISSCMSGTTREAVFCRFAVHSLLRERCSS